MAFIYTHSSNNQCITGQLFDTSTGIRYTLSVELEIKNRFLNPVVLRLNSAHVRYDEVGDGPGYYKEEALQFWARLTEMVKRDGDKQDTCSMNSVHSWGISALQKLADLEYADNNNQQNLEPEDELYIPF